MTYRIEPTNASGTARTGPCLVAVSLADVYTVVRTLAGSADVSVSGSYATTSTRVVARVFDTGWLATHKACACNVCAYYRSNGGTGK